MSIKKITDTYKKKIALIKKHNKYYYNEDKPQISDADYDKLKNEVLDLEKKNVFLKDLNIFSETLGAPPTKKFKKINHLKPMLSLSNAFDKHGMIDFLKKIKNYLNLKEIDLDLISEPKIDGISATLIYENGLLKKGLSRGDGYIGEDILENLKTIKEIPKDISGQNVPKLLEIRCEIFIGKKDFFILKDKFANPRNAAGGSLRQKILKILQKFH